MSKWFSRIWRAYREAETLSGVWVWPVTQALLSVVAAGITVMTGVVGNLPVMYIWVAALVSLVVVFTGLVQFREWKIGLSPKENVFIENITAEIFAPLLDNGDRTVKRVQLGIILRNNTNRPVQFVVNSIDTTIDGRVNMDRHYLSKSGTIPTHTTQIYHDSFVPMDVVLPKSMGVLNAVLEGEVEYYWENGRKHLLNFKKRVTINCGPETINFRYLDEEIIS